MVHKLLAHRLALQPEHLPQALGHHDTGLSHPNPLRSFGFGPPQYLGQPSLGLGDSPNVIGCGIVHSECSCNAFVLWSRACLQTPTRATSPHVPQGQAGLCLLFIPGGDPAAWLQTVDGPLHSVASPVPGAVAEALVLCMLLPGDGAADAPTSQTRPALPTAVPLVATDPLGSVAGTAHSRPLHRPADHQLGEHGGLMRWSRRQPAGPRLANALSPYVDLRAQTAAGAAQGRVSAPLWVPAACGCARTTVPSPSWMAHVIGRTGGPPSARDRSAPVRHTHRMPLRIVRWSWLARPGRGFCAGSHCGSVRSPRPLRFPPASARALGPQCNLCNLSAGVCKRALAPMVGMSSEAMGMSFT